MKTIQVTFSGYTNGFVTSSYDLEPTKRKGFYAVNTAFWKGIVSRNSVKATYWYYPEYTQDSVESFLNKIREQAFN